MYQKINFNFQNDNAEKEPAGVDQGPPKDVPEAQAVEVVNGDNIAKETILQTVDLDPDRAPDQ